MLEYQINVNGNTRTLTSDKLLKQYAEFTGFQPLGISSDGARGIYKTPQGIQEIDFHQTLPEGAVTGFKPKSSINAENMTKYRLAVDSISDPDIQQAYLQNIAKRDFGLENPIITGSGVDRYLWDPNQNSWVSLTNKEGFDVSDLASGALSLGKGVVSGLGALGGGALGGLATTPTVLGVPAGVLAGAAAGGAAGTAGAEALQRKIQAELDPAFNEAYEGKYLAKEAGNIGKQAAISGALSGVLPVAGTFFRGAGKSFTPIGSTTEAAGKLTSGAGKLGTAAGNVLQTDAGRFAQQAGFLDPTGLSQAGALGGMAKSITQPIAQGVVKAGDIGRQMVSRVRNLEGPTQSFAGKTWEETAKNFPNAGKLVEGIETLGSGLEKGGRIAEDVLAKGIKGTGNVLDYGGRGTQLLGQGIKAIEPGAQQAGAQFLGNKLFPQQIQEEQQLLRNYSQPKPILTRMQPAQNYYALDNSVSAANSGYNTTDALLSALISR
jgi:hypothetical protein